MKKIKTYSDSKQTMWEMWFVSAITIMIAYLFVGTLEGSKEQFPNWLPFALLSCLNVLICIIVGCRKRLIIISDKS